MAIWIKQNVGKTEGQVFGMSIFGTSIFPSLNHYIHVTVAG
jgi:hypothetical protein